MKCYLSYFLTCPSSFFLFENTHSKTRSTTRHSQVDARCAAEYFFAAQLHAILLFLLLLFHTCNCLYRSDGTAPISLYAAAMMRWRRGVLTNCAVLLSR